MGIESYKHKFAKAVLAEWLRSSIRESGDWLELAPFQARTNRGGPFYGVFEEYPVCLDNQNRIVGCAPVWDEELSGGAELVPLPPTYDECLTKGLLPLVIFDIFVIHKGAPGFAIEVVHRNPISDAKAQFLRRIRAEFPFLIYTVEADWVLSQIKRPSLVVCQRA